MENVIERAQEMLMIYGLKIVAAIVIFIAGRWIAKIMEKILKRAMDKRAVDATVTSFVGDLIYITLMVIVILAALNQLGVQTTSFIAIIGAAGLAIGLDLQGSLSTFAAGFLMIIFRPFKAETL